MNDAQWGPRTRRKGFAARTEYDVPGAKWHY